MLLSRLDWSGADFNREHEANMSPANSDKTSSEIERYVKEMLEAKTGVSTVKALAEGQQKKCQSG